MADTLITLKAYGVANPYEELRSYLERLESLSSSKVKKVMREVIDLNNLQILILGDKDKMDLQKLQKRKWASFEIVPFEKTSF